MCGELQLQTSSKKCLLTTVVLLILIVCSISPAAAGRWDWRINDGVTPVKESGGTCCWAFAMMDTIDGSMKATGFGEYDFSEESLKECSWHSKYGLVNCANGGSAKVAINHLTRYGLVLEEDNPYHPFDTYCYSVPTPVARVTGWDILSTYDCADTNTIKNYVRRYGAVYSTIDASCIPPNLHREVIVCRDGKHEPVNHAVTIVGWDDELGPGCWICKNSDGTSFGDRGYFYIQYKCYGIGTYASAVTSYEKWCTYSRTLGHDESGWTNAATWGYGRSYLFGLCKYQIDSDEKVTHIEFWTTGETDDVDLHIYDGFNGGSVGKLIYKIEDLKFRAAGYHSVKVPGDVRSSTGTIAIAARINNVDGGVYPSISPIAYDESGVIDSGKTYLSRDGRMWVEMKSFDVALRLVVQKPIHKPTPTPTPIPTTVPTIAPVPTPIPTPVPTPYPENERSAQAITAMCIAVDGSYDAKYDVNNDGRVTAMDALMILQNGVTKI